MRKAFCLLLMLLLAGCRTEETFETVTDEQVMPVMAQRRHICVELPGETSLPVMGNDNGRVYLCDDYEIMIQTMEAGDLEKTMQSISGHERADMTVMETFSDDISRYEFVWASLGEKGDRTGRGVILDDGSYHYCMSVLRNADPAEKSQINWDQVFSSFSLASY